MGRSYRRGAPDETGRDSRLKVVLLVVALVLVAGYALTMTPMSQFLLHDMMSLDQLNIPIIPVLAGLAIVVLLGGLLVLRKRRPKGPARVGDEQGDALAGLVDRKAFLARLEEQVAAHAKSGRQLAVHIADIDKFRILNEVLGEAEGDAFLRLVAEKLLVLVNDPARLARTGDDEFAIIQPETGGARHAEIYARRIQDTLKDACAQVPRHARPGASIGVAVYPEHGQDVARLMRSASLALHEAKKAGGNTFRNYARAMEMVVDARLQMEQAISDGLSKGWFEMNYQPQYDLATRRLIGFEALVRMNHPELGELLPEAFLPAAQESGLIQPLGEWIIREALAAAAEWPDHLTIAINVALAQLRHGDIAETILSAIAKAEIDPRRVRVEVTEAVLMEETEAIAEQLKRLKSRGLAIVLDDFGLESSSLQSLAASAIDAAKLDRTLVDRLGESPETEALVRSLIGTAQSFDLDLAAEGVERPEQAHFLMASGCHRVQGFLFGRPAALRDVAAIIAKDMRNAVSGKTEEGEGEADDRSSAAA